MHKRKSEDLDYNNYLNYRNSKNHGEMREVITNPLYIAIMSDDIKAVEEWCNNNKDFATIENQYGTTPLHWAAQHGNEKIALLLLKACSGTNLSDHIFTTLLEVAIASGHLALGKILINYTDATNRPFNMLHNAALSGSDEEVKSLLQKGADPKILTYNKNKVSALHLAASVGSKDKVLVLLQVATYVEFFGERGITPEDVALESGYKAIARIISQRYESLKIPTLIYNIQCNHINTLKLFTITIPDLERIAEALKENHSVTELTIFSIILEETISKVIANLLEYNKSVITLKIHNCKLNNTGAENIGKAIEKNKTLTCLTFTDNYLDIGVIKKILSYVKLSNSISKLELMGVLIDPEVMKEITEFIKLSKTLAYLNIEGNGMPAGEVKEIMEAVKSNNTLIGLSLSGNYFSIETAVAVANFIGTNQSLTSLNLMDNYINETDIENLQHGFRGNEHISYLNFSNNLIGQKGAILIAAILKVNPHIGYLNLGNNQIEEIGAKALCDSLRFNHLTNLVLSDNNLGENGAAELSDALTNNDSVKFLDLSNNHIGKGAKALALALRNNHGVRWLNLSNNEIKTEEIIELASMIKAYNRTLTCIYLNNNEIDKNGIKALAEGMLFNNHIAQLYLANNNIGAKGAGIIATMLDVNTSLTTLDLTCNQIGFAGVCSIMAGIKHNPHLTHLYLCKNKISIDGAEVIAHTIRYDTTLVCLTLTGNQIFLEGVKAISRAVGSNKFLTTLKIDICPNPTNNHKVQHKISLNQLLVKELAEFLLNKFESIEKRDSKNIKDIHHFKFSQKVDESLLREYMSEELKKHSNDKEIIKSKIESILIQTNQFINDHYLFLRGICKENIIEVPKFTIAGDKELFESSGYNVPVCAQIFDFIGKTNLWPEIGDDHYILEI